MLHPRRTGDDRSLSKKYEDYDNMVHSSWDGPAATRATVQVPGKQSVAARMFGKAKDAVGSSISNTVKAGRGLFTGGEVDPADPNAAQRRKANTKQKGIKGMFDLITGVRNADLMAGFVKKLVKKK